MPGVTDPAEASTQAGRPAPGLRVGSGPPRVLAGRYRLDRVIGRGAMGTVWAAYDETLHRPVAIKEVNFPEGMPGHEAGQLADRTLREARAIAAMSNPHVITLFDILNLESGPVIVMELLTARSLAQVLRQDGPLRDTQAATIGVAVAGGLLAAHSAGITHRDVKPGNVLIAHDGRIKLTDFGIARSADEQTMTATGLLLGSPAYISPEVASGKVAGSQSDAWGLGALLFAAVQGRPPYDRGDPIATLTAVVSDPVPAHPQSGRLGGVIDALLVKDPRGRLPLVRAYHMLQEMADDPTGMRLAGVLPVGPGATGSPGSSLPVSSGSRAGAGPGTGSGPMAVSLIRPPRTGSSVPAPSGRINGPMSVPAPAPPTAPQPGRPLPSGSPVPPPPWAGTTDLQPLPARSERRSRKALFAVATVVGLAAAVAGFFGVRAIADLNSAPAPTVAESVLPG